MSKYIKYYIIFGFVGWILEYVQNPSTIAKCGDTLITNAKLCIPFLNIYSTGAIILLLLKNKFNKKHIVELSIISGIILTLFECISGKLSLYINKKHTWNYKNRVFPLCDNFISIDVSVFWIICSFIFYKFINVDDH